MLSRLREHLGTAGLVVAIVALVAALAGGAIAAGGHGDEATVSAKAKKGPRGPKGPKGPRGDTGPVGPAGPQGPAGAKGEAGAAGAKGATGATGLTGAGGATGGTGAAGSTGATGATGFSGFTATLPSGQTETGAWAFGPLAEEAAAKTSISFPIPLAALISSSNVHAVPVGGPAPTGCTGGTAASPKADPGHLCVYATELVDSEYLAALSEGFFPNISQAGTNNPGASATGATVNVGATAAGGNGFGTFAVTAP